MEKVSNNPMKNYEVTKENGETISYSGIVENIQTGDFLGKNTWNGGLIGDAEELMGWHGDPAKSTLTQQDRIAMLRQFKLDAEKFQSNPDAEKVAMWAEERVRSIMEDEAIRFIKEFKAQGEMTGVPEEVQLLIKEIDNLEGIKTKAFSSNRVMEDTGNPWKDNETRINEIFELKLSLYNLVFEQSGKEPK